MEEKEGVENRDKIIKEIFILQWSARQRDKILRLSKISRNKNIKNL